MVGEPLNSNRTTARWPGRLQTNELGQNAHVLWLCKLQPFNPLVGGSSPPGGTQFKIGESIGSAGS